MLELDLETYRLRPDAQADLEAAKRSTRAQLKPKRHSGWFIWGPIPGAYVARAASLPGKSLHLWLALWFEHKRRKGQPIRMTRDLLARFHVSPDSANRALSQLERAGLVSVNRARGRLATIQMLISSALGETSSP
ncbi:MAG: hypothetical protein SGJ19_00665 [Planctomycetia bacterium]|nr:hypothetical protein [Planctomycetia bacterium]